MPLASSTVMTPSLPTFCIASEIILPISTSPLAAIAPTCAVSAGVVILRMLLQLVHDRSHRLVDAALEVHRVHARGHRLGPSRTIAGQAPSVVVPSPAMSLVFEATSRTICAPMFSNLSPSSISLATVTLSW